MLGSYFGAKSEEWGVVGVVGEAEGAGGEGVGELLEGEKGKGKAVVGFKIEWAKDEGGGAVEGCGAVVLWFGVDVSE